MSGRSGTTGSPSSSPITQCESRSPSTELLRLALTQGYSDGLRVDSGKHVETSFWSGFSAAAGVYMVGEVFDGDPAYVTAYQQYFDGVMDYPR